MEQRTPAQPHQRVVTNQLGFVLLTATLAASRATDRKHGELEHGEHQMQPRQHQERCL